VPPRRESARSGDGAPALDAGHRQRVAEKGADGLDVNQWLKKAVLLSFA
jgi:hypothetical protein